MMINAADNVQCVAVMGLSLKLPKVCLYFCTRMHMDRTEALQLEMASCVREWSGVVFSPFVCDWFLWVLFASEGACVVINGPQRRMYAVW